MSSREENKIFFKKKIIIIILLLWNYKLSHISVNMYKPNFVLYILFFLIDDLRIITQYIVAKVLLYI